jgi:hypothetical protein
MGERFLAWAVEAEERLESCRDRNAELERHIAAVVRAGADPLLLSQIENVGELLVEMRDWCERPGWAEGPQPPPGWLARANAQLHALRIFKRDEV